MANRSDPDYSVGYGRPPAASQFKPGQSGNPRGRPKGAKNFAAAIEEELNARVRVTENGRCRRLSKREVIVKTLVNQAAAGDLKAIAPLIALARPGDAKVADAAQAEIHSPDDQEIMQHLLERLGRAAQIRFSDTGADSHSEPPPELGSRSGDGV